MAIGLLVNGSMGFGLAGAMTASIILSMDIARPVLLFIFMLGYLTAKWESRLLVPVGLFCNALADMVFETIWKMLGKPPLQQVVFKASSRTWAEELSHNLSWISHGCLNCDAWNTHFVHAALFHVYNVRNTGDQLGPLRTCSASRSALIAVNRARRHDQKVHVILVSDEAALVDVPVVTQQPWFRDLCSTCLSNRGASTDISGWASCLQEVVLDRCAAQSYRVRTVSLPQLTWMQQLAVRFQCERILKLLL